MLVRRKTLKIFNLIITTVNKQKLRDKKCFAEGWARGKFFIDQNNLSAINPVIHSLQELRNNTWDVERVDQAINWLKDNFEVK